MSKILKITILVALLLTISGAFYYLNTSNDLKSTYKYSTVENNQSTYDVVKLSSENISSLKFFYKDENKENFGTIQKLLEQKEKLIFATNGGIFSVQNEPLGLYIEDSKTISELNTDNGFGNFYLKPNGVFLIEGEHAKISTSEDYKTNHSISYAVQSGPMLVINNEINEQFNKESESKYIRNGVGIDSEGNVIFAISNNPVTFYEFAVFFRDELDCNNALYLDGAISEMYIPKHREHTDEVFTTIIGIESF